MKNSLDLFCPICQVDKTERNCAQRSHRSHNSVTHSKPLLLVSCHHVTDRETTIQSVLRSCIFQVNHGGVFLDTWWPITESLNKGSKAQSEIIFHILDTPLQAGSSLGCYLIYLITLKLSYN